MIDKEGKIGIKYVYAVMLNFYDGETAWDVVASIFDNAHDAELLQREIIENALMIKEECPKYPEEEKESGTYWQYYIEHENWLHLINCTVENIVLNAQFDFENMKPNF